jgi:GT2 family glycosyltransferase
LISLIVCTVSEDRYQDVIDLVNALWNKTAQNIQVIIVVGRSEKLFQNLKIALGQQNITVIFNNGDPGLSYQRNLGIEYASGKFIGFLDDDVVPSIGWLSSVIALFKDPRTVGVTGPVLPLWSDCKASIPDSISWVVSCTSWVDFEDGEPVPFAWGGNMVFRREIFDAGLRFDCRLGLGGSNELLLGEETDFSVRARTVSGGTIRWSRKAVVWHKMKPFRSSFRYLTNRSIAMGFTQYHGKKSLVQVKAIQRIFRIQRRKTQMRRFGRTPLFRGLLAYYLVLACLVFGFIYAAAKSIIMSD